MNLLAVSHSYVVDLNQQIIQTLGEIGNIDVSIVAPAQWKGEYGLQGFQRLPASIIRFYPLKVILSGQISFYFFYRGLRRIIRRNRPDVVFLHAEPWSFVALQIGLLCRRYHIPLVVFTNQNLLKHYPPPFSWIEQFIYNNSPIIAVLSEDVSQVLLAKGFKNKIMELAYPCDLALFVPGQELQLRDKLKLKGVVVGYIGRIVKEKGLDTLIRASLELMESHAQPEWTVLLVGSGDQEETLKKQVNQSKFSDRFVFAGSVPHNEAPAMMRCFDIMVLPSKTSPAWKEQFGRVVIEALSCEIPVVGSNSGHIPHLINETQGGSIFDEGDADDLAQKLLPLLSDQNIRRQLGQQGRRVVIERYSQEAVAGQLYNILKAAVAT